MTSLVQPSPNVSVNGDTPWLPSVPMAGFSVITNLRCNPFLPVWFDAMRYSNECIAIYTERLPRCGGGRSGQKWVLLKVEQ